MCSCGVPVAHMIQISSSFSNQFIANLHIKYQITMQLTNSTHCPEWLTVIKGSPLWDPGP